MAAEGAILLKDVQGERSHGKLIGGLFKSGNAKLVCRGELVFTLPRIKVIPRKDGKPAHNYQIASDPTVTLFCTEEDLGPLSDYEYHLMVAIKSREARFEVFWKDVLVWGSKLKEGTFVCVTLPSKKPLSNQRAVSLIRYIGPLPNENGIHFGVEIQEEQYRHHGSSNGFFGGEQYFECDENCALFVSLDRLSQIEPPQQDPEPQPELPLPTESQRQHQMTTQSRRKDLQSDLDRHGRRDHSPKQLHSRFIMNDRVVVRSNQGIGVHGTVRWIEEVVYAGNKLMAVGIEMDVSVQSKDFVGSLPGGLSRHFKCTDSRHGKLVMPESLVTSEAKDAAQHHKQKEKFSNQEISVDAHAPKHEHVHAQCKDVAQQGEDEYLKSALCTVRFDREQQMRVMREIEKNHKGKKQNASDGQLHIGPKNPQSYYPGPADSSNQPLYHHPSSRSPGPNEQHTQPSTGANMAKPHVYAYDSPNGTRRDLQKLRDQRSIQDDHLLRHRPGGEGGNIVPLRHQRSMPGPGSSKDHQIYYDPNIQDSPSQYMYHHGALQEAAHGIQTQPQGTVSHSFFLGSTIQLLCDPPRYGVIQWIGTLPGILEGRIAGVELEEPIEGGSDGTWNGVRYFSSRQGYGFFCPLASVSPDQRFAQATIAAINPLDDVPLEEPCDQFINPGQIWSHTFRYLRYTLVVLVMFLLSSVPVLCPVLWYLWIHAGSANANFFFAMTLTYVLAQVFLLADMIYSFLVHQYDLLHGLPRLDENGTPIKLKLT